MRATSRTAVKVRQAGVVTGIVPVRGRSDRLTVFIEGARAFDLAFEVLERSKLRRGDRLDEVAQERLVEEDAPHRARDKALRLLADRERCSSEIERRLRMGGFTDQIAAETVSWLRDRDLVDDKRFAAAFCDGRLRAGWGERQIRSDLLRRGVDRETIDGALRKDSSEGTSAAEGLDAVMALAKKRFGEQFARDPATARRRLAGFMGRRGYDWDAIGEVARRLAEQTEQQEWTDQEDSSGWESS